MTEPRDLLEGYTGIRPRGNRPGAPRGAVESWLPADEWAGVIGDGLIGDGLIPHRGPTHLVDLIQTGLANGTFSASEDEDHTSEFWTPTAGNGAWTIVADSTKPGGYKYRWTCSSTAGGAAGYGHLVSASSPVVDGFLHLSRVWALLNATRHEMYVRIHWYDEDHTELASTSLLTPSGWSSSAKLYDFGPIANPNATAAYWASVDIELRQVSAGSATSDIWLATLEQVASMVADYRASDGDAPTLAVRFAGDTDNRLEVSAISTGGTVLWGSGSADPDVELRRTGSLAMSWLNPIGSNLAVTMFGMQRQHLLSSTDQALGVKAGGDANDRMRVRADGRIGWNDGTAAGDEFYLDRASANVLRLTDAALRVVRAATSSTALAVRDDGDTVSRLVVLAGGDLLWSGGSAAADARLRRTGVSDLTLDDNAGGAASLTATGRVTADTLASDDVFLEGASGVMTLDLLGPGDADLVVTGDVTVGGNYIGPTTFPIPFVLVNIPDGATTNLQPSDNALGLATPRVRMLKGGSIRGLTYRLSAAPAATETLDINIQVGGATVFTVSLTDASNVIGGSSQAPGVDTFAAADGISVNVVASSGFGSTTEIHVNVWITMDDDGT